MVEKIVLEKLIVSYLAKEIDPQTFDKVVCSHLDFENLVGGPLYTEMLSCNYISPEEVYQLREDLLVWAKDYYHISKEDDILLRLIIVTTCRAFLANQVGAIETSRHLTKVYHNYFTDFNKFDDFRVFVAVDSETDHLPINKHVREHWNSDVLKN